MSKWKCSLCSHFSAPSFRGVIRHIGEVHQYEPNFQVKCGVEGCSMRYSVYGSFRSHVYRKHRDLLGDPFQSGDENIPPTKVSDVCLCIYYKGRKMFSTETRKEILTCIVPDSTCSTNGKIPLDCLVWYNYYTYILHILYRKMPIKRWCIFHAYSESTELDFTCTDASVVAIQEPNPKRTAALFVLKTRQEKKDAWHRQQWTRLCRVHHPCVRRWYTT